MFLNAFDVHSKSRPFMTIRTEELWLEKNALTGRIPTEILQLRGLGESA